MTTRTVWEPPEHIKRVVRSWPGIPWYQLPADTRDMLTKLNTERLTVGDLQKLSSDLLELGMHLVAVLDVLGAAVTGFKRRKLLSIAKRSLYLIKGERAQDEGKEPLHVLTAKDRFATLLANTFGNEPFEATPAQLAVLCSFSEQTTSAYLQQARRAGLVRTIKPGTISTPSVYKVEQPIIPPGTLPAPSLAKLWREISLPQDADCVPSKKASELYVELRHLFGVMTWFAVSYKNFAELASQGYIRKYSVPTLRKLLRELEDKGYLWHKPTQYNKPSQYYLYDL